MAKTPPKVRACLFDMDGLLIDSERIYTEVTNIFLAQHGKGPLPLDIKVQLMGRPGPHASRVLLDWAQIDISPEELFKRTSELQKTLWSTTKPLPGAENLIRSLINHDIPIAVVHFLKDIDVEQLATSSHRNNFILKTTHLHDKLFCYFKEERIVVGDDNRIPHGRGKPHPDIYLLALSTINDSLGEDEEPIRPEECLVFEDAVLGVQSARNAGMQVVWVPDPLIKGVLRGQEEEILGEWGKEVLSLAEVRLEEYGIGREN